ncbi:glycine amidinotransferase, mitochondrial-like [Mytilus californianus]|uniref:glycine amidinotransferase, mitochondrial-like n=1 Tax=Mytilus californianus TaxID=6549 RepID=UPI002246FBFA|nr:glycine amidinotransferase, mitochondrial-like [Mytilus californianus]
MMDIVSSYNEWDPLEEVILGIPDYACIPQDEPAYRSKLDAADLNTFTAGLRKDETIQKARVQFDNLARILEYQCNVKLLRPEKIDFSESIKTPFFEIENQNCAACPRDTLLVIGNEIIETPMSNRARYFESMAYRKILNDIWEKDKNMLWTNAPKPTMADSMYNLDFPWDDKSQERKDWIGSFKYVTNETEPVFDAADVLRLGKDLVVQNSFTTNRKGIEWLRRHTKSRGYRVHEIHFPDDLSPVHIDCSLIPLVPPTKERKGILMNCPERPIAPADKERIFSGSNWEIQNAPRPFTTTIPELCQSSYWLCMNLLLVSPDRAIVEETEIPTINYLESLGIKCIRVPFRDVYGFGGGIHCVTSDIRRRGDRKSYFPNFD